MSETSTEKKIITTLVVLLALTAGTGAFAISLERQQKVEIANAISSDEREIARLRRDNEELSVRIAKQESPACLSLRAGSRMTRPVNGAVVWAYENFDGGRVEFKGKGVLSFKTPAETKR